MQTASPVDGNVAFLAVETRRALHAAACADAAELEQPIENRTVIPDVVLALLSHKGVHVVRRDSLQEFNVFVGMELRHLGRDGRLRALREKTVSKCALTRPAMQSTYVDLKKFVNVVVHDE